MKIFAKIRDEWGNSCLYLLVRNKSKVYWEAYNCVAIQQPGYSNLPFTWDLWTHNLDIDPQYDILVPAIIDYIESTDSVQMIYIKQEIPFEESHLNDSNMYSV